MKKIFVSLFCLFLFIGNNAQDVVSVKEVSKDKNEASATMDFITKVVDYGVIEFNSNGEREFVFTNNGTIPLVIKSAKASCGCTVPNYPKEPIMPGSTEKIKVKYATNRVGVFTKTITLSTSISERPIILTIKGEVKAAKKDIAIPQKNNDGAPIEKE